MNNNYDIENSIRILKREFMKIRDLGYIESIRKGPTGIGATFEYLLGKKEDKLEEPDFMGIELKTKRGYSKSMINLFNYAPIGNTSNEAKRIRDNYGYPDKLDRKLKRFSGTIGADKIYRVGLFYSFKLKIDRDNNKLYLLVYNTSMECIDKSTYWDLDILKEKLYRKLKVMALIKAWPKRVEKTEYYKYTTMKIYTLRDFESFLKEIELGMIKVSFRISNNYTKERYGEAETHGVGFVIAESDLFQIFK